MVSTTKAINEHLGTWLNEKHTKTLEKKHKQWYDRLMTKKEDNLVLEHLRAIRAELNYHRLKAGGFGLS